MTSADSPVANNAAGLLYLVATPIGNLEDITRRALRVLAEADVILCEDTRHTGRLLHYFGITTRTLSYYEHNEESRASEALELLRAGQSIALVSDAGTPVVNDPGFRIVRLAVEHDIRIVPVPGAAAFVNALIASGLPTDEFFFGGFLPARAGARRARLASLRTMEATLIFYETPHRIHAALADAHEMLGDRQACVARELTKLHEQFLRGRLSELIERFSDERLQRGEMVVVIDHARGEQEATNPDNQATSIAARISALEADGVDSRHALKQVARELGVPRAEAYRRLVAEKREIKNAK